jgi:hypothetical protein
MKKVPSALKWLAEKRARIAGQVQASQQVLELASAQVESLERELVAMKAFHAHSAAKVAQHTEELACLDGSVVIYDASLDPREIGTVNGWAGRYGKRGALREFLIQVLESRAPDYVSTSELALLTMAEFSLVFDHWKLRKTWYEHSLRNALKGLKAQGRIEASVDPLLVDQGTEIRGWRIKRECPQSLAALRQG